MSKKSRKCISINKGTPQDAFTAAALAFIAMQQRGKDGLSEDEIKIWNRQEMEEKSNKG